MQTHTIIILDCTLRDGGYYNNWDFGHELVDLYLKSMGEASIDVVEIGFRSPLCTVIGRPGVCQDISTVMTSEYPHASVEGKGNMVEPAGPSWRICYFTKCARCRCHHGTGIAARGIVSTKHPNITFKGYGRMAGPPRQISNVSDL